MHAEDLHDQLMLIWTTRKYLLTSIRSSMRGVFLITQREFRVAQRKSGGPITLKSQDRNLALKLLFAGVHPLQCCLLLGTFQLRACALFQPGHPNVRRLLALLPREGSVAQ